MPQPGTRTPELEQDDDAELGALLDAAENPPAPKPGSARKPARPATQPEPAPEAPQSKPAHSRDSMELAAYYGFDPLDVDSWSPAELNRRITARTRREFDRRQQPEPTHTPAPQHAAPAKSGPDEWDDTLADPKVAELFRRREAARDKELAELRSQLADTAKSSKERSQLESVERLDDAFASLGESAGPFYGEGSGLELRPDGPEMRRRHAVLIAGGIDFNKLPPLRVLINRLKAADAILRPAPAAPEEQESEEVEPANPYARTPTPPKNQAPAKDPRTGRFLPRQDEWERAGLLRPSAKNGKVMEDDAGHTGFADPDEFEGS